MLGCAELNVTVNWKTSGVEATGAHRHPVKPAATNALCMLGRGGNEIRAVES